MPDESNYESLDTGFQVSFPGPFEHHDVVVSGRQVPFLRAMPLGEDQIHLNLDRRLGVTLTTEEAERILPFVADCIAVASGFTSHPDAGQDGPTTRHPFPAVHGLMLGD